MLTLLALSYLKISMINAPVSFMATSLARKLGRSALERQQSTETLCLSALLHVNLLN